MSAIRLSIGEVRKASDPFGSRPSIKGAQVTNTEEGKGSREFSPPMKPHRKSESSKPSRKSNCFPFLNATERKACNELPRSVEASPKQNCTLEGQVVRLDMKVTEHINEIEQLVGSPKDDLDDAFVMFPDISPTEEKTGHHVAKRSMPAQPKQVFTPGDDEEDSIFTTDPKQRPPPEDKREEDGSLRYELCLNSIDRQLALQLQEIYNQEEEMADKAEKHSGQNGNGKAKEKDKKKEESLKEKGPKKPSVIDGICNPDALNDCMIRAGIQDCWLLQEKTKS